MSAGSEDGEVGRLDLVEEDGEGSEGLMVGGQLPLVFQPHGVDGLEYPHDLTVAFRQGPRSLGEWHHLVGCVSVPGQPEVIDNLLRCRGIRLGGADVDVAVGEAPDAEDVGEHLYGLVEGGPDGHFTEVVGLHPDQAERTSGQRAPGRCDLRYAFLEVQLHVRNLPQLPVGRLAGRRRTVPTHGSSDVTVYVPLPGPAQGAVEVLHETPEQPLPPYLVRPFRLSPCPCPALGLDPVAERPERVLQRIQTGDQGPPVLIGGSDLLGQPSDPPPTVLDPHLLAALAEAGAVDAADDSGQEEDAVADLLLEGLGHVKLGTAGLEDGVLHRVADHPLDEAGAGVVFVETADGMLAFVEGDRLVLPALLP